LKEDNKRLKTWLKFFLKVALSATALYIVSKKIDINETWTVISSVRISYLFIAIIFFIFSHVISAYRLNMFFIQIGIKITSLQNLKLYSIGMFYNLFLPGGIGGDAYKVIILKQNKEVTTKKLVSATLLDRISGLVALFCLTIILLLMSSAKSNFQYHNWMYFSILLLPLAYVAYYLLLKLFLNYFIPAFGLTNVYSWGKQIFQLLAAFFLLKSLFIEAHFVDYLSLFMVSSVVAVAPISIGGVGLRELAFVYAYQFFMIDKNTAVAFTLLFFIITVFTSFIGGFINLDLKDPDTENLDKMSL